MKGLIYLYQRTIANRIKKALKRPVTYIMGIFVLFYIVMVYNSFNMMIEDGSFNSPDNLVTILSITIFWLFPANLISYARRRGLLFRPSEVHFVFSSPVSPKMVLMFAGVKSFSINIILGFVIVAAGLMWFEAGIGQVLVYFLFFVVFESILEASAIIFCYGSDSGNRRISDDYPGALLWAFAGIFCHAGDSDGSGGGMECRGNQADFPGSGYGECDRHDAVSGFHASDVSGGLADDMHRGVL